MRRAFIETICDMAKNDDRICLIIGDLGFSVVEPFADRFPSRFLNAGVAEQNMMSMAAGWSMAENKVVFVYSIANFPIFRCLEQIRNDVCYHRADVKIISVGAGLTYGAAGFSHFAVEDLSVMRAMPGMVLAAPADAFESEALTRLAVETSGPFFLRIGRNSEPPVNEKECSIKIGVPLIHRTGDEVLLISSGTILSEVVKAASLLEKKQLYVSVLGLPVIKPLNNGELKKHLLKKKAVITVEEHTRHGGLGSVISELITDFNLGVPLLRIGLPEFIDHVGSQQELRKYYRIDHESIAEQAFGFACSI